jgi:hypothetical protein
MRIVRSILTFFILAALASSCALAARLIVGPQHINDPTEPGSTCEEVIHVQPCD